MRVTCPAHIILLDLICLIMCKKGFMCNRITF
jgi:hypothetical protein